MYACVGVCNWINYIMRGETIKIISAGVYCPRELFFSTIKHVRSSLQLLLGKSGGWNVNFSTTITSSNVQSNINSLTNIFIELLQHVSIHYEIIISPSLKYTYPYHKLLKHVLKSQPFTVTFCLWYTYTC